MLASWCKRAGLDPSRVIDRAWTLMAGLRPLTVAAAPGPLQSTETHKAQKCAILIARSTRHSAERTHLVTARMCSNVLPAELLRRIRAEYLEMPGLRLTAPQARCLFGLDAETGDAVLAALVDAKFLSQTHNGMFAMASNTGVATGRTAGIGVDRNVTR